MSSLILNNSINKDDNFTSLESADGLKLINIVSPKRGSKGSKVLETGCGTGHNSMVLADLVGADGNIVGIDPEQERLQLVKEKYSAGKKKKKNTGKCRGYFGRW